MRNFREFICNISEKHFSRRHSAMALFGCAALILLLTLCSLNRITITDSSRTISLISTDTNAKAILASAGIDHIDADIITTERLGNSLSINLDRAFPVVISCGNTTKTIYTQEDTVANIAALAGISLSEHDLVSPAANTLLTAKSIIDIVDIDYTTTSTTQVVPFTVKTIRSPKLLAGTKNITAGADGVKVYTYKNKFVDGEMVETTCIGEEMIKQPVDMVITIGTGTYNPDHPYGWISNLAPKSEITVDAGGAPVDYVKKMVGTATAYHGDTGTSTGATPQPGYIAVNPKVIPYGTKMYIRSTDGKFIYGYAIAADTGGACMKNKIIADLYFPTEESMHSFGRREIEIYILE